MGAPDVLARITAAGISLKPLPDGRIWAEPAARLTNELRDLIRAHKPDLLAALHPERDEAAERRWARVLAALDANPDARYAVMSDTQALPGFVLLTMAIRGVAVCEFRIPREKWDGVMFIEMLERHGATLH